MITADTGISHPYSDYFYQKRFSDDIGIRYHIEFFHYAGVTFPNGEMPESWMVEMNQNEPHMTFQLHRPESIEQAESAVIRFWYCMFCDYHERNEP